jgi:general L-amino acid transport system permease protein
MSQSSGVRRLLTYRGIPLWRDVRVLQAAAQVVFAMAVVAFVAFLLNNFLQASGERGFSLGYEFLGQSAGFGLSTVDALIEYDPSKSFGYAFLVGILNTLKVALAGVVLATILGTIIGVARLSSNWLVSKIAAVYVEVIRNVPVLIQLFIWYFAVILKFPTVAESIQLPGPIFLNIRGMHLVWAKPTSSFSGWLLFVAAGILLSIVVWRALSRIQINTGRATYPITTGTLVVILIPVLGWLLVGENPLVVDTPVLVGSGLGASVTGGLALTPEFAALLIGLVVYTASFIAEIVRAGIQSVQRGQVEAARALGLSNVQALRLVIFPQALRVIIPPLISQFLNLTKNSSLAIAIGYNDLFFVGKTMINQAGRAVPVIILIMGSYLAMSLTYALIGNLYNRRVRIVER